VQAIADDLGFADASNFVTFFKRESGCTPTVFRARQLAAP
jgi:AraC-like DNA-binding protein